MTLLFKLEESRLDFVPSVHRAWKISRESQLLIANVRIDNEENSQYSFPACSAGEKGQAPTRSCVKSRSILDSF